MQTTNNYNIPVCRNGGNVPDGIGVFNGETGKIQKLDVDSGELEILFDDGKIGYYELTYENMSHLNLAYATTYHKSQGSEFKFVICLLTTADFILLQRKIIYTGESRAKDLCVFVGNAKSFQMAINDMNGKAGLRYTLLCARLKESRIKINTVA